ncbi:uncharacterized protein H6S33_011971 [Morchella sextelata]|uniref:uncharacterized protein n=1 Tax=Morchella sextelata TaxID=1174677 RepID=UPI001D0421EC|nr:uncharacterized protein H6S33_011971 [Morchella sextelata]KAH0610444.1 hypothetical protein H6S33_011971 [Morchella sextelata]
MAQVQSLLDHAPPLSTIYLTSRTPPKIIHNITSSILSYHPLDITTPSSIEALYKTIKEAGGIDVLVNNAGNGTGSVKEIVEFNYYGGFRDEELRAKMAAAGEGTIEGLDALIERYRADVKAGVSKEKGWPHQYSVTKAAITAAKITMARDNPELLVNCCCPGRVETETGVKFASRAIPLKTIEEGARILVRLAAEDIGGISGKFWKNSSLTEKGYGQATDWCDENSWSLEDKFFDGIQYVF